MKAYLRIISLRPRIEGHYAPADEARQRSGVQTFLDALIDPEAPDRLRRWEVELVVQGLKLQHPHPRAFARQSEDYSLGSAKQMD
jgi:hypothetical protein